MEVISGVVSAIFLMGFNCMYITYNNPRYNIWIQLMLSIVLVICLLAVYKNIKKIVSVVSIVLAVLFLVESYTTIDPITYKVFDNIYTSDNTKIVHTGWDEIVSMPADITLYNSQNRYLDITFDEILEQEKYDEDTDVLLIGKFENYDEYENMKTCYFDGKFFDFTWDKKECKRQYVANDNSIPLNILYQSDFEKKLQNGELNDKAILIIAKQFNNHENEILNYANSFYNIGERKEKKIKNQGSLYYYILERRN